MKFGKLIASECASSPVAPGEESGLTGDDSVCRLFAASQIMC